MAVEIPFEAMYLALNATRGATTTPPTHGVNLEGMITPNIEYYYPPDRLGVLAEYGRSQAVRQSGAWSGSGGADVTKLPIFLNMLLGPLATPATSGRPVASAAVGAGGSAYTTATVTATGGGGFGAVFTATLAAGVVTAFVKVHGGYEYSSAPTLTVTGDGTGATGTFTLASAPSSAKYWVFPRVMTADTIKDASTYWGDPNQKMYQGLYSMITQMVLGGDASGTDAMQMSFDGFTQFPTDLASVPTLPAVAVGPLLMPGAMELWIDSSSAIGTTRVTGRLVSAELTAPNGVVPKYVAVGPAGSLTYDHVGRQKTHPELRLVLEMVDQTQYVLFKNGTDVKVRVRWNGPAIETNYYYAVQADIYGKMSSFSWGELEGANRTMEVTIMGEYNATAATDLVVAVQNAQATL